MSGSEALKNLPSVDKLLRGAALKTWDGRLTWPVRVRLTQGVLAQIRHQVKKGKACPDLESIEKQLEKTFQGLVESGMKKVINSTGVVLHTNLGRAPLGEGMLEPMLKALDGYCSLEFDLSKGDRGSRTAIVERLVRVLCGVPAALVVNNNAAATYLILHTFAAGKEVLISRGELVQIGGGYRVPDILAASGAKLVEVGTTNMTSVRDYEARLTPETGMLLQVHQSNFFISGHTESADLAELVQLAKKANVMLAVDLGSGLLRQQSWDKNEPTVEQVFQSGAELTCFSGDKLLGGPQAGIIVGDPEPIERLRKSPLYRALRLGKTELFLLEQTLQQYVQGKVPPTWEMLEQSMETLERRCTTFVSCLSEQGVQASLESGSSSVGGGTMPHCQIPTQLVYLPCEDPERFAKRLRTGSPAVVPRLEKKRVLLDLRTVLPSEEAVLVQKIVEALA